MSILDKLIGLGMNADVTDTTWWTETVYRELAQANSVSRDSASDSDPESAELAPDTP